MSIRTSICLGLLLLAPLAVYWQTVFHEYGLRDDYSLPREVQEEPGKLLRFTASNGRPIYAILLEASLARVNEVEDLRWLRLAGVMLLTGVGLMLWRLLRRSGWPDVEAAAVGLAVTLLPAAQVTATWAISWPNALALLVAVTAFAAVESGFHQTGWKRTAILLAGSIGYLVAGLTYQSNALFAIAPLAAVLLMHAGFEPRSYVRWIAAHLALLIGSLAAGFLLMTLLFSQGVFPEAARMGFETEPLSKLLWFFWQPIANALALFVLRDRFDAGALWFWSTVIVVAAIIANGFRFDTKSNRGLQKAKWLVCLLFLPFVAHGVSLAAAQRAIGYRTLFALSGLVVVLLLYSLRSLHVSGRSNRAVHHGVLALVILFAAIAANRNSFTLIAESQGREWDMVRDAAYDMTLKPDTKVYIITPAVEERSTRRVFADEFGSVSTNSDWVPREMFKAAMRERFPKALPAGKSFTVTVGRLLPHASSYDLVIDLRRLREYRVD